MNERALRAEMARNNYTIPAKANTIGIGKKALYAKMRGESQFKQAEIKKLKSLLSLTDEQTVEIFLQIKFLKGNQMKTVSPPNKLSSGNCKRM